jgi:hypothetical protein
LFIFILKITKTATKFSTTETKMFTISRTKNTQARQTSGLFFVFFTSLRLILRASDHLLISKTVVWAKRWTIIVSKSGGRGQSQVQGISKTFTISWMGVE